MNRWRDLPRAAAGLGLGFLALSTWRGDGLAHTLIGFSVLTLLPLGFAMTIEGSAHADATPRERKEVPFGYRLAAFMLPGALLGGFFAFTWLVGTLPSVMSAGAIGMFTTTMALYSLQRVVRRGLGPRYELAVDLACLLVPVAAVWLFASRLGVSLLGVQEPAVLLTAERFFRAGFGAPLLFGVLGRHLGDDARLRRLHGIATAVVCAAIPLTAIGNATLPAIELGAALVLAAGTLLGAWCIFSVAKHERKSAPRAALALGISAASLGISTSFAAMWALNGSARDAAGSAVALDEMLRWHGAVGSFGFLGCGLLGLTWLESKRGR